MSKVKIGILGAGFIAKVHVDNLKKDERVEVVAVVDLYLEKAQALAKEAGPQAKAFGCLDELRAFGIDAVYVTTPNKARSPSTPPTLWPSTSPPRTWWTVTSGFPTRKSPRRTTGPS